MKAGRWAGLLVLVATVLLPRVAAAEPQTHDGFFLRLSGGFGYLSVKEDTDLGNFEITGTGAALDIAIGGRIADNLALHGTLFGGSAVDPTFKVDGDKIGTANDTTMDASAIGVGLTYYVEPANVYLSGSLGAAHVTLESGNEKVDSETGWAIDAIVGKEWWVGSEWGLGVAAQFNHLSVPDKGADTTYHLDGNSFALMFTATYN